MLLFISPKKILLTTEVCNIISVPLWDPKFLLIFSFIWFMGPLLVSFMLWENTYHTQSDRSLSTGINVTAATCWVVTGCVGPHISVSIQQWTRSQTSGPFCNKSIFCAADLKICSHVLMPSNAKKGILHIRRLIMPQIIRSDVGFNELYAWGACDTLQRNRVLSSKLSGAPQWGVRLAAWLPHHQAPLHITGGCCCSQLHLIIITTDPEVMVVECVDVA